MTAKSIPTFPFAVVEREFRLASYWFGARFCPAVFRREDDTYGIRILASVRGDTTTYDYFELAADGTVLKAPRGYARNYKPGRIGGLDEALAKYADPGASA